MRTAARPTACNGVAEEVEGMSSKALALAIGVTLAACAAEAEPDAEQQADAVTVSPLAECASPLMSAVYDAALSDVAKGNVPADQFATSRNTANPKPLVTAPEIFPAMHRLIESAEHEVAMQFYVIYVDCDAARELFSALKSLEKRRRDAGATSPVAVRLLFSVIGLGGVDTKKPADIAREVEALGLDPQYVTFELATYVFNAMGNLHSKDIVVDGARAIITGANVQGQNNYAAPQHDTAYEVGGEVAQSLQSEFDQAWSKSKLWKCGSRAGDFLGCSEKTKPLAHQIPKGALPDACMPMLVTTRPGDGWPFSNGIDNTQDRAFLALLTNAKSVVRIHTPNLNDDTMKRTIVDTLAQKPTLVLEVVLSKGFNDGGMNFVGGTNEETVDWLYERLAKRGVTDACERLRLRWYAHDGAAVDGNVLYASHTKYMSADGQVAIVGSANMDNIAWNHSRELNIVVDDARTTSSWDEAMFNPSFSKGVVVDQCKTTSGGR